MAIVFEKQKKTQRILILIFIVLLLATIIFIWQGFFKEEEGFIPSGPPLVRKEIKINFDVLKNPILGELQPFFEIEPFKEVPSSPEQPEKKIGRENPFIPY